MKPRGEITVFVSLTLVCVLSLFLGLLESARTAGARLYLRMASDSAMSSVMSQYNRNLWDMYRLLFLEYESEAAIKSSFESYLDFYLEQENFYPARKENVKLMGLVTMMDDGGAALEEEILAYIKYRFPEVAANMAGIAEEAKEASKAGDFKNLFDTCRQAGKRTRAFEKAGQAAEYSLQEMGKWKEMAEEAAESENKRLFQKNIKNLQKEMEKFSGLVDSCEKAVEKITEYRMSAGAEKGIRNEEAAESWEREFDAYEQAETAAREKLSKYREIEAITAENLSILDEIDVLAEPGSGEEDGEDAEEMDWEAVREHMNELQIPETEQPGHADREKAAALDRLEGFFNRDILSYVIPPGAEISNRQVSLKGSPSDRAEKTPDSSKADAIEQMLVNEYIFLFFRSFVNEHGNKFLPEDRPLVYEQEYLLCGNSRDRENLRDTADRLLVLRGAMNLLYLLNSPEKRAEADGLAAAVSSGIVPAQLVLSFFILTLWAAGEAVLDVKELFAGGAVPFWKGESDWKTSLENLLAMEFLEMEPQKAQQGRKYEDYMRILFILKSRQERNFRMMDLIQWNVQEKQKDFSIQACAYQIDTETEVIQKHVFALKSEYEGMISVTGSY